MKLSPLKQDFVGYDGLNQWYIERSILYQSASTNLLRVANEILGAIH